MDKAFFREYGLPIVVTALLHALLLFWLALDFVGGHDELQVKRPKTIQAQLVQLKEKRAAKQPAKKQAQKKKPKKKPKKDDKKKQQKLKQEKLKKQQAQKLAKEKATKASAAKAAKVKADKERLDQEQVAREKLQKEALEREALRKQAEAESVRREQEEAFLDDFAEDELMENSSADEASAMSHMAAIQQAVEANWSRPPSARNGMEVVLAIQLFPTGQVNNVNIVTGSGNAAFDRSAVAAVQRAERFPELASLKPHVFEKYYRSFKLVFKPEDLRL